MIGKLKKVDLRKEWKHEANDFTKWLAQEENLALLSEEIGITIKVIQTEAKVGSFNVDILAEEERTGRKIVIENQLETTNHEHLGKVITYASGYDAEIVIWIVKDVRDEHKQAIDWLNEHTDEKINFFAIKMELWQIGDSPYAPKFYIISKPNDWAKALKMATRSGELSEAAMQKMDFIKEFISYCEEKKSKLRLGRPQPATPSYYTISIGNSNVWIAVKMNSRKNVLFADLYILNKELFHELEKDKENINKEFGKELRWDDMPQHKGAVIGDEIPFYIEKEEDWNKYFEWIKDTAERFQKIFTKYLRKATK